MSDEQRPSSPEDGDIRISEPARTPGWLGSRTYPRAVVPILAAALVVSLLTNLLLAIRIDDERAASAALRQRVDEQQDALDALRGEISGSGDALEQIAHAVERIRGLTFKQPVQPELLTSDELVARIRETFLTGDDREEFEANARVAVVLGLVDADVDLWEIVTAAQEEQIGGFYDTREQTMVVEARNARRPTPLDRLVLSHEYTHALTDQYVPLRRLDELREQRADDQALALLALAEGDAQLVSELYARSVLTDADQLELLREVAEIPSERLDQLPPFLREAFEFPYTRGLDFVRALHRSGGFEAVDAAYRDPPTSTEQILHPNRYVRTRDEPVEVTIPELTRALGAGWRTIDRGGVGELDVLLIADHGAQSISRADARRAADGWDGGRYVGLESDAGVLVAAVTAWDSVAEAREATRLFARWLPLRFGNVGSAFDAGAGNRGWESPDGAGVVLRDADRVTLVLGPARRDVERAAAALS